MRATKAVLRFCWYVILIGVVVAAGVTVVVLTAAGLAAVVVGRNADAVRALAGLTLIAASTCSALCARPRRHNDTPNAPMPWRGEIASPG